MKKIAVAIASVLLSASQAMAMFGASEWNDDMDPPTSDVGGFVVLLALFVAGLAYQPKFTLFFISSVTGISILLGKSTSTFATIVFIASSSGLAYLSFTAFMESRKKKQVSAAN